MDTRLKDNEWILLNVLWKKHPLDMKEIIAGVQRDNSNVTWDYKTYHSFLRILLEKGYVTAVRQGKNNLYSPAITREEAISRETDSLAERRGYFGSVSGLMVNMADQGKLTEAEKEELMELARRLAAEEH